MPVLDDRPAIGFRRLLQVDRNHFRARRQQAFGVPVAQAEDLPDHLLFDRLEYTHLGPLPDEHLDILARSLRLPPARRTPAASAQRLSTG
jgi:hypothetical protein